MRTLNENIIADLKEGKVKAFEYVYRYHYPTIVIFAIKLIGDKQEAEDIVSDVFVKFYLQRDIFQRLIDIKAWLYIATRNACFNYLKHIKKGNEIKKQLIKTVEEAEFDASHKMYYSELVHMVNMQIEKLPKSHQDVIKLSLEGYKTEEIAEKLDIPIQTVRNRRVKAQRELQESLRNQKLFSVILPLLF